MPQRAFIVFLFAFAHKKTMSSLPERFEPSSRTFLISEQLNPWQLLHHQDKVSRHRGAELRRRYELLGGTSLLSLEYLLSVELPPRLMRMVGSLCSTFVSARHVRLTVKLACAITLSARFPFAPS